MNSSDINLDLTGIPDSLNLHTARFFQDQMSKQEYYHQYGALNSVTVNSGSEKRFFNFRMMDSCVICPRKNDQPGFKIYVFTESARLVVGAGGFAATFKVLGRLKIINSQLVYKSDISTPYLLKSINHCDAEMVTNEVAILQKFPDMKCKDAIFAPQHGRAFILYKYFEGITLSEFISNQLPTHGVDSRWRIAYNLIEQTMMIHDALVTHNDLKPDNIIINPHTLAVRIIDFGLSFLGSEKDGSGTFQYMSSEALFNTVLMRELRKHKFRFDIDYTTDIFSLGMVLLEIFGVQNRLILKKNKTQESDIIIFYTQCFTAIKRALAQALNDRILTDDENDPNHGLLLSDEAYDAVLKNRLDCSRLLPAGNIFLPMIDPNKVNRPALPQVQLAIQKNLLLLPGFNRIDEEASVPYHRNHFNNETIGEWARNIKVAQNEVYRDDNLRQNILGALHHYIVNIINPLPRNGFFTCFPSFNRRSTCVSAMRAEDIKCYIGAVVDKTENLVQRIDLISKRIETGFFGRSKLKSLVKNAVTEANRPMAMR